jgi:hypothetical protein
MADIDIERKSGPPIWAWLLGLLALALLIWLIASMMGRDDSRVDSRDPAAVVAPAGETTVGTVPPTLQQFRRDCAVEEGRRTDDMGAQHEFTVRCFEQLAASMEEVSRGHPGDPGIEQQVRAMREQAQQMRESDPESTEHSTWTRQAAESGATALESMQSRWYAQEGGLASGVADVRRSAEQIDGGALLLDQLTHLRSYFRRAGDVLEQMAQRQPR